MHHRLNRPRRGLHATLATAAVAVLALSALSACSGGDDRPSAASTSSQPESSTTVPAGDPASPTLTTPPDDADDPPVTSSAPSTTPTAPPAEPLALSVYWSRPAGQPRPIDIPAYRDPAGGPYPFVLYGALTNNQASSVATAGLQVTWVDAGGTIAARTPARVVGPDGSTLSELAAGATADLIVVVDDPGLSATLADLAPGGVEAG